MKKTENNGIPAKIRTIKRNNEDRYAIFESEDYSGALKELKKILSKKQALPKEEVFRFLSYPMVASDFMDLYPFFHEDGLLAEIELFIIERLDDPDRLYVSDLIEFAMDFGLNLPYEKCLGFLNVYKDDHTYVVLASIGYITANIRMLYIAEIVKGLEGVLNNPEQNQSSQIKAALGLFRITMKRRYLNDLMDLVVAGHPDNKDLMRNLLKWEYNHKRYFDYADTLHAICRKY